VTTVLVGRMAKKLRLLAKPPDPTKSTVLDLKTLGDKPAIKGPGGTDFTCGACGATLLEGVQPGQISGIVLKCSCGAFNQT
jgi:hypothetical protein